MWKRAARFAAVSLFLLPIAFRAYADGFQAIPPSTPATPPAAKQESAAKEEPAAKPPRQRDLRRAEKLYLEGAKALEHDDLKTAQQDFAEAVSLDPANQQYQAANVIARQHGATALVQAADKAQLAGRGDEARDDLALAFQLDPTNPMVAQHINEMAREAAPDPEQRYPEAEIAGGLIELAPTPGRHSFHLHAGASELLRQVLTPYGIAASLDSSVKSQPVRFDVDDVDFNEAARILKLLTGTFFVPLDPHRVLVAQESKENRTKFERLALETVYFPGLTQAEITDMNNIARNVFEAQMTTISPTNGTLTIRAPESRMAVFNSTLKELLEGRSEIQLDVRLLDIAKTRTRNIGIQLPQQATVFNVPSELNSIISGNQSLVQQIISSGLAAPGDFAAIAAILIASGQVTGSVLNQPFALFGGGLTLSGLATSGVTGNLALNSTDSRILDNITLRVLDQEESTIRSGTRYPIITSSYSSLSGSALTAAGISNPGVSSALSSLGINPSSLASAAGQTIPQVQYQDLGLTLKVKPYIQKDRDVTLNMDLKITSLQGTSLNNIPVLDNQQFTAVITLHEGATALAISSLSKQQSRAVTGVPGLSDLPGFQSATNQNAENDVSNLVVLITPHIVRLAHTQEAGRMFLLPVHP